MKRLNLTVIIFLLISTLFLCKTTIASSLFYARLDFSAGDNPSSIAIGDLDGDGALDLAVANYGSDNVSVLINVSVDGSDLAVIAADFSRTAYPTSD